MFFFDQYFLGLLFFSENNIHQQMDDGTIIHFSETTTIYINVNVHMVFSGSATPSDIHFQKVRVWQLPLLLW